MKTDAPAPARLNPAVIEMARLGPGIDQIKVEPKSWIVSILQALSENRLRFKITIKSITGGAKDLFAVVLDAKGPLAIAAAALVMMMLAVLAVFVTARVTSASGIEPSRRFEQVVDPTRVANSQIEKREQEGSP